MEEIKEPEVWKDIPGFEGIYQVSSWGKVKSLDRFVNHKKNGVRLYKSSFIKIFYRGTYQFVCLHLNNLRYPFNVNVLVAICFLPDYDPNKLVNHKDKNKDNNYYKNLEMVTARENVTFSIDKTTTSSKYIGVRKRTCVVKGKVYNYIVSDIYVNGKTKHLGSFKTEEEAHQAYLDALIEYNLENKYAEKNTL